MRHLKHAYIFVLAKQQERDEKANVNQCEVKRLWGISESRGVTAYLY